MFTLCTFGDSILDCGAYNDHGVSPGQLLVRNDDDLFPEFRGRDLASLGPARLVHRARDGSTVDDLPAQASGLSISGSAIVLVTVGGNDLLHCIHRKDELDLKRFSAALGRFLSGLGIRPVLVGNVYDPTMGNNARNILPGNPSHLRAQHQALNEAIAEVAAAHGRLVDLHAHFLAGKPDWFVDFIEPSLVGASEIRRCFLADVMIDCYRSRTA
jgi:GDSL-like Lipase/Acylhydrolase family